MHTFTEWMTLFIVCFKYWSIHNILLTLVLLTLVISPSYSLILTNLLRLWDWDTKQGNFEVFHRVAPSSITLRGRIKNQIRMKEPITEQFPWSWKRITRQSHARQQRTVVCLVSGSGRPPPVAVHLGSGWMKPVLSALSTEGEVLQEACQHACVICVMVCRGIHWPSLLGDEKWLFSSNINLGCKTSVS